MFILFLVNTKSVNNLYNSALGGINIHKENQTPSPPLDFAMFRFIIQ